MAVDADPPYQSLYRRFRPATFAEVEGQDHIVLALRNAVRDGRVAHAYLFSGPRGTGKTSTARILAKALNCTNLTDGEPCGVCASCVEIAKGTSLDVHELDAASNNGVEAMRDLVARAALGTPGRQKVYIVDEVHMLSTAASNALLKTLEEPPPHVVFVLATTDPQKVLPTIRSRTQHFEFRLFGPETLSALLTRVRDEARLDVPDEAIALAVRRGRGSARDALSVLDQVAAAEEVDDDLPDLVEILEALADRDVEPALVAVARLVEQGHSPQQLAGELVDQLRECFMARMAPDLMGAAGAERERVGDLAGRVGLATLVRSIEVLGEAQVAMRDAPDPRVNLEVALVRLIHPEADDSPQALLARIERLEAGAVPRAGSAPSDPPPTASVAPASRPGPRQTGPSVAPPATAADTGDVPGGRAEEAPPAAGPSGPRRTLGAHRRSTPASPPPPADVPPHVSPTAAPAPEVPPSEAPPAVPDAVDGPAGVFPSRDAFVQLWGDHVVAGLRPKAKALYQAGRFVSADPAAGEVRFGLPNDIHRARCEEMRGEVEEILATHIGRPVRLVLVVDEGAAVPSEVDDDADGDGPAPTPPATPAGGVVTGSETRDLPPAAAQVREALARGPGRPDGNGPAGNGRTGAGAGAGTGTGGPGGEAGEAHGRSHDEIDLDHLEDELGEVADIDNSAESRVLRAFPGAEEVS